MNRFHACEQCRDVYRCKLCSIAASRAFETRKARNSYQIVLYHPDHEIEERKKGATRPKRPWLCGRCAASSAV